MKNVELCQPKIEDLWFRQICMEDPKTMNYNAGYDVHFDGYHYDTGCIDFPSIKHKSWFEEKMTNPNFFYAYILDKDNNNFVGYVNFNKNENNKATMGIVINSKFQGQGYMRPAMKLLIERAKDKGVSVLSDTVPNTRVNALKVFFDLGFEKVNEFVTKKFNQDELVYVIEKVIN